MKITFIGHGSLSNCPNLLSEITGAIMENASKNEKTLFYCGGYGDFDNLCAKACSSLKNILTCEVIYVTPYITQSQQEKIHYLIDSKLYDSTLYPPLENVPYKFAISKRNEWMINESDLIIAFVKRNHGGAYKSLAYAKRKKKKIINLGEANL